ncbi:Major Facilitator Superfamily [uncultured Roseburia sp.]|uniref:MFS transporter n=1 Tax=Brotonthovivens ammoniilytica TaxID=2981725 RepID=A0ABT2TQ43_9FIRM|nr:MFS transporter [Brotonthovivens ammoniilytica]MCU6763727.1 MFS transporter [Brotonthovivens ammoniilytica]SCJ32982.1 Major Facilitator Superfamily [uncultured Roseburia sp.]
MVQQRVNSPGFAGTLAMLSLTLMGLGSNAITPALATLADHFEGRDVSFIQTIATLSMVAGSLAAGAAAGKRMKIKTLALLGSLLCLVFGILPVWIDSYGCILLVRLVFGFALGVISPLGNALIMTHFKGNKQAALIGIGTFSMNIGGIVFQMLSGVLADISWQLSFLGHSFFIVAVVMAFFLPKEELIKQEKSYVQKKAGEKINLKTVMFIGGLLCIFQIVNLSVMMSASTIYDIRGAGGAAAAAAALTAFSVTGMFAGLLFGMVFRRVKRFIFFIAFIFVALGAYIILTGSSGLIMGLGYALIGIGFNWQFAAFTGWIGISTPQSTISAGTSIVLAMMNLGGFFSSFWMMALGGNLTSILLADVVLCILLAVLLLVINPFKGKK